jgi:hypothetical protein
MGHLNLGSLVQLHPMISFDALIDAAQPWLNHFNGKKHSLIITDGENLHSIQP